MEFGQLDEMLSRITRDIEEKEAQLNRLILEVQVLRRQAKTLEDTRVLLIEQRPSVESYASILKQEPKVLKQEPRLSLQNEVLACFAGQSDRSLSAVEIVILLRSRKYPSSDGKNFYVNVYTTLKRLAAKGKVVEVDLGRNRKAYKLLAVEQSVLRPDVEET